MSSPVDEEPCDQNHQCEPAENRNNSNDTSASPPPATEPSLGQAREQSPIPRPFRVRFRSVHRSPSVDASVDQANRVGSIDEYGRPQPVEPPATLQRLEQPSPEEIAIQSEGGRRPTARDRIRNASQLVRRRTARLTTRLGRPVDEGDDLGAAMLPDYMDAGEAIPLTGRGRRRAQRDEEQPADLRATASTEAHRLVRALGMTHDQRSRRRKPKKAYVRSGQSTPDSRLSPEFGHGSLTSIPGGGGILSQLLKLHASQMDTARDSFYSAESSADEESPLSSGTATPIAPGTSSPPTPDTLTGTPSGTSTPRREKIKWYKKPSHRSTASLVEASMNLSRITVPGAASTDALPLTESPGNKRRKKRRKNRLEEEIRVTVHIAEILARQRYIMQLCRALMRYGAPTHRLEEYMQMTARVLDVDGQFLYLPGCMIMSFDDPTTRTAEVKLVRTVQGVDLGRLADTHNVYKNVVHDLIGVEEAIQELDEIMKSQPRFDKWIRVLMYGLASVAVGPFAFEARPIDMPIIFVLGCLVGVMQHVVAPTSVLYSNVFEVTAAVLTSFLSRAFGSIRITVNGQKQYLFCFSAMAQSSIALILPGFLVLCSSLELQSHQMIAGSIRMVYAIIYSLFLGYGITVGTTIYGLLDGNATSETHCSGQSIYGSQFTQHFVFVAIFAWLLALINHAKWKQTPVMVFIAEAGYVANFFSTKHLGSTSEVANSIGAFTIGVLGNLYSRIWHGHAAAAILPAIFVLVPSGLASSNSLIAGLEYSNEVKKNLTNNATLISDAQSSLTSLGFGMIQVAIGITVGLFIAALIVYPFGKRRSGLFSF